MYYNEKNKIITLKDKKRISIDNIVFLQSKGNYTIIYLNSGDSSLSASTLKCFEDSLPQDTFIRPNRSTMINKLYIDSVNYQNKSITLKNGQIVNTSRRKKKTLKEISLDAQTPKVCKEVTYTGLLGLKNNLGRQRFY